MTTQREMKERLIDARYQAEKELRAKKDELGQVKRDCEDLAMYNMELMAENAKLKEEREIMYKLIQKLDKQVNTLIFERDVRLATMRELRKKLKDRIK